MYDSPKYQVEPVEAEAFVQGQRHGTLIAVAPGGFPETTILPFVKRGDLIELHCVQEDPTFAAIQANPLVTFLVSDFLAFSRHDWVDPVDGGRATLNFRAVLFECRASLPTRPEDVAAALGRLLGNTQSVRTSCRTTEVDAVALGGSGQMPVLFGAVLASGPVEDVFDAQPIGLKANGAAVHDAGVAALC